MLYVKLNANFSYNNNKIQKTVKLYKNDLIVVQVFFTIASLPSPFSSVSKFTQQKKKLSLSISNAYINDTRILLNMQTHVKQRKYIIMFLLFRFMNLFHMKRASVTLNVTLFLYVESHTKVI